MRILLTNDDGFNSEGIQILEKVLCSYGHEVLVLAPSTQQSATSHCITVRNGVQITSYGENHYHLLGTPADCILYGQRTGLISSKDIDMVISGINEGSNVSSDILYSGTLGAARQAVLEGFKAIAISCSPKGMDYTTGIFAYEEAAIFTAEHLEEFKDLCSSNSLVNINVPNDANGEWLPCGLSFINYHDRAVFDNDIDLDTLKNNIGTSINVKLTVDPSNLPTIDRNFSTIYTDFEALESNKISVSVLTVLSNLSTLHQDLMNLVGGNVE
jgi:5'-nucleotidase